MNIFIDVVGCTANQSDASIARFIFESNPGYQIVHTSKDADLVLLFTCTVIASTEQRMLSKIKAYQHNGKTIVVTGCMASIQTEQIKQINPDIICIPPTKIHQLLSYLSHEQPDEKISPHKFESKKHHLALQAPIAISEGCDFSCSYCITTLARGNLKSVPPSIVKQDIVDALQQGCKEIQLTAQDTASYGRDRGTNLATLLKMIPTIQGIYRCRIGMMNPASVLPQLDALINSYHDLHIYKFLHLPIQSGDNELLHRMNRTYTIEDVTHIINRFRKQYPDITIATDVIVGFPSETEKQHQQTSEILKKIHPDIVNITKFSARPHTKAKKLPQRIPTHIVKKRSTVLTDLVAALCLEKNKRYIGKTLPILIIEEGKQKTLIGRTNTYKPVVLHERVSLGDVVDVEINAASQTHLVGILK